MKTAYYLALLFTVFVLVSTHNYNSALLVFLAGGIIIFYSFFRKGLESEFREFEEADTKNPFGVANDLGDSLAKRTGEEIFGSDNKEIDPIEGAAKGLNNLIDTSKKVFKK